MRAAPLRVVASDFYTLHRPSRCELRVYLDHIGVEGSPPGPFEQVFFRLGERHEAAHLAALGDHVDLRGGAHEARQGRTYEAIVRGERVLYQPVLRCEIEICGKTCEIVGEPDFLIREGEEYIVRDSKLARQVDLQHHPEIIKQIDLSGALYERSFGRPPLRLEVHRGTGDVVRVSYQGERFAISALEEIVHLKGLAQEAYVPVGWSKCNGCHFRTRCWQRAEESHDVALVPDVDQGLVLARSEA
jgi:predicted RecB family nuclease